MRNSASLFLALMLTAGAAGAKVLEDVVAKVDGRPLMLSEYRKNLRSVLDTYRRNIPEILADEEAVKEIRQKVLDQMIDDEILVLRAEKGGIKIHEREVEQGLEEVRERSFRVDPVSGRRRSDQEVRAALELELKNEGLDEAKFKERIEKQLKVRRIVETEVKAKLKEPDDERAQKAFDLLKKISKSSTDTVKGLVDGMPEAVAQGYAAFGFRLRDAHSTRARVNHILIKTPANAAIVAQNQALAKAKDLKKKLDAGEDFFEIAQKNSDDAESAARGGDMGFMIPGQGWMPEAFEKVAFSLPVGETSEPVQTEFGWHIIRVQEKKAAEPMLFEKLHVDIKQFLMNLDFASELDEMVKRLRAKSTIEVKLPAETE